MRLDSKNYKTENAGASQHLADVYNVGFIAEYESVEVNL